MKKNISFATTVIHMFLKKVVMTFQEIILTIWKNTQKFRLNLFQSSTVIFRKILFSESKFFSQFLFIKHENYCDKNKSYFKNNFFKNTNEIK